MVLAVDPEAVAAMEQGGRSEVIGTTFYGSTQTIPSDKYPDLDRVPLADTSGSITWDADQQQQAQGSCFLTAGGASLVPQSKTDPLAPFGQELQLVRRVHYANASWDIPGGRFRIGEVPSAKDSYARMGWSAQLNLVDLFDKFPADFLGPVTGPSQTASTWDEVAKLSPLPVVRSLPDATIPSGVTFQNPLDAVTKLITNLGGEPAITRDGALTARLANAYLTQTAPVATVKAVVSVDAGMSNDLINSVAVTNPNDATILGIAQITDPSDPLCITGPLGVRTKTFSDPLMDTPVKAQKAAETYLARLSTVQARVVKVTCLPRWDLELGDFIQVNEYIPDATNQITTPGGLFGGGGSFGYGAGVYGFLVAVATAGEPVYRTWLGEVRHMEWPIDPTALMSFELTVADTR